MEVEKILQPGELTQELSKNQAETKQEFNQKHGFGFLEAELQWVCYFENMKKHI